MSDFDKEFSVFVAAAQVASNKDSEKVKQFLSEYQKEYCDIDSDTLVQLAEELFQGRGLEQLAEKIVNKGTMFARQLPEGTSTEVVSKESIFVGEAYGKRIQFTPVLQLSYIHGEEYSQLVLRPFSPMFLSDICPINWGVF